MNVSGILCAAGEPAEAKQVSLSDIASGIDARQYKAEMEFICDAEKFLTPSADRNDLAEISQESKRSEAADADTVRVIEKLLEKLKAWQPFLSASPEKELAQLKALYTDILKQVLQLTENDEIKKMLCLLETHMLGNLEKLKEKHFHTLDSFFYQFGEGQNRVNLFNSLFKAATGRALPAERIRLFLSENGMTVREKVHKTLPPTGSNHEGILYSRCTSDKAVPYSKAFSGRKLTEADYWSSAFPERPANAKDSVPMDQFSENAPKQNVPYQMQDLKTAEKFLSYFLNEGNMLDSKEITSCSIQFKGLLAAAVWLKTDTFLQTAGMHKSLSSSISRAVDKMVLFYINNLSGPDEPAHYIRGQQSQGNTALNIYFQLKIICQKEQNAGTALASALKYAYAQFTKQNENESFFFYCPGLEKNDCRKGFLLLKKDWKRFVDELPAPLRTKRELEASFNSPWGDYISPLNPLYNPEAGHPAILGGVITAGIIIAFCLFT